MRLLHTMLRVGNLDKSLAFYTEVLNMKLLRRKDYPDGRFTLAFVGYGEECDTTVLELTHNWDTPSYDLGAGYGHIAIEVDNAAAACDAVRAKGGKVIREAAPMKHGTTVIAFVEDPDGYKIEFIEKGTGADTYTRAQSSAQRQPETGKARFRLPFPANLLKYRFFPNRQPSCKIPPPTNST